MSSHTSITIWLEGEELPDLYRLLGRPLLDPDIDGLTGSLKAAARELLPYQNHADPLKARRAMNLLTELGRVESLLADPQRLAEINQRLIAELAEQCAERFAAAGPHWERQAVCAWLQRERQISPAALAETFVAVCAALPEPPVAPKPVPIPARIFAAPDASAAANEEIHWGEATDLQNVTLDDDPSFEPARRGAVCPHCGAPVAAEALLCINCGYDFRTRQRLETKTSRKGGAARPVTIRPPPPPGYRGRDPAALRRRNWRVLSPKAVAVACGMAVLVLVVGGLGLLAKRVRSGNLAETMAIVPLEAGHGDLVTSGDTPPVRRRGPEDEQTDEQAAAGKQPGQEQPADDLPETTLAKGKFDAAYRRATTSTPGEFVALWDVALRLAPDDASRRLVHQTKIASLIQRPLPLPADVVERLCAAYDLYLADAKSIGEQLTIADSLVFALRQKQALEMALSRYLSLRDAAAGNSLRQTLLQRLTQECLSSVSTLPVGDRLAACERLVSLANGDEATRAEAYRLLARDPAVVSQVPLEKLWEIFDVVLDSAVEGPLAAAYLRALIETVRRRGAQVEAAEHYRSLLRNGRNRALAQRVLDDLARMELARNGGAFPPGAFPPGAVPPGAMPPQGMMPGSIPPGVPPSRPPSNAQPPSPPPPSESEPVDLAAVRQSLELLKSRPARMRASEAELQELYDSLAEQIGRTIDLRELVLILIEEFERRRRINHVIGHYEQELKNNPDSLPALYFLVGAYQWRANKGVNANNFSKKSRDLFAHLQTLAPVASEK